MISVGQNPQKTGFYPDTMLPFTIEFWNTFAHVQENLQRCETSKMEHFAKIVDILKPDSAPMLDGYNFHLFF